MSISSQANLELTQTGPGTLMGHLFRRYWVPILISTELPKPDCDPVRVKVLSEKLLAFRDSSGKVGLIDEFWKFSVKGNSSGSRRRLPFSADSES